MYDRFKWTSASLRRNRLTQEYEPLQPFFFIALAERAACRTFIDVGANIGAYSLFATLAPSVRHVVAFEADPATFAELKRNVSLNSLDTSIKVHGSAVSDAAGELAFGSVGRLSGANSVVSTSIHESTNFRDRYMVEATTLDNVFATGADEPLAIKIDVEGHEPAVLKGGEALLRANRAIIQIECYERSGNESRRLLSKLGFEQLTAIGPDHYFTNIDELRDANALIPVYEQASRELIDYYHRDKPVTVEAGDLRIEVTGRSADFARNLKRRVRGKSAQTDSKT